MAKQLKLSVKARQTGQKSIARTLRNQGMVPAIAYGKDFENINLAIDTKELYSVLHSESGINSFLKLDMDGKDLGLFVIKDLNMDPLKRAPRHVDLMALIMDREMNFMIPIEFEGNPQGVRDGGILEEVIREAHVRCTPKDIVEHMKVDVSAMKVNDHITIADLAAAYPSVKFMDAPDALVVTVSLPRSEVAAEAAKDGPVAPEVIHGGPKKDEAK